MSNIVVDCIIECKERFDDEIILGRVESGEWRVESGESGRTHDRSISILSGVDC